MTIMLILTLLVEDMFCLFYFLMYYVFMYGLCLQVSDWLFFYWEVLIGVVCIWLCCITLMESDAGCKLLRQIHSCSVYRIQGVFRGNLLYFQEMFLRLHYIYITKNTGIQT